MGATFINGVLYGGSPEIQAAAGAHINEAGTPTVSASTSQGVTTFTFDYLKGQAASAEADGIDYDNTDSGMDATNVQDAIDELSVGKANGEGLTFTIENGILYVDDGRIEVVPFATATDAQLKAILDAYYANKLSLADLQAVWNIGDKRTVSLSAMESTRPDESYEAQDIEIAIAGFDMDTLTTPINGHTKAALTLTQVDGLDLDGSMNDTDTNEGSWSATKMRTWCNSSYYNALPNIIKFTIKQVNKITAQEYDSSTNQVTNDYCWLLAIGEIFNYSRPASEAGNMTGYSNVIEYNALTPYPYYNTSANRTKKRVDGITADWWTRSPHYERTDLFCFVYSDGEPDYGYASSSALVAPCFCM